MTPDSITSVRTKSRASKISQPSPKAPAEGISPATTARQERARPMRMPVKTKGSAPGITTLVNSLRPWAPIDWAARTQISLIVFEPVQVLKTIGGNDAQATSRMVGMSPSPNQRMKSGTQARPGIGFRMLTIGTQKFSTARERAISRPSGIPKPAARTKPISRR